MDIEYPSFIGIDPGGNRLGIAVYTFNPDTLKLTVAHVDTYYVDRYAYKHEHLGALYGERFTRLKAIEDHLDRLLEEYKLMWVAIETPFYGRLPAAFSALLECVGAVRQAIINHSTQVPLYNLSPMAVKHGVGSKGKEKEDVALDDGGMSNSGGNYTSVAELTNTSAKGSVNSATSADLLADMVLIRASNGTRVSIRVEGV